LSKPELYIGCSALEEEEEEEKEEEEEEEEEEDRYLNPGLCAHKVSMLLHCRP